MEPGLEFRVLQLGLAGCRISPLRAPMGEGIGVWGVLVVSSCEEYEDTSPGRDVYSMLTVVLWTVGKIWGSPNAPRGTEQGRKNWRQFVMEFDSAVGSGGGGCFFGHHLSGTSGVFMQNKLEGERKASVSHMCGIERNKAKAQMKSEQNKPSKYGSRIEVSSG